MSAGNASLAPEAVQPDDPDEDLIACRICLISFDEQGRLPKYMVGCHHYFCMSCIQVVLVKGCLCFDLPTLILKLFVLHRTCWVQEAEKFTAQHAVLLPALPG